MIISVTDAYNYLMNGPWILSLDMWHFPSFLVFVLSTSEWNVPPLKDNFPTCCYLPLLVQALCLRTMSSASNASFLTSKWKVPSFVLFLPRWHQLSPFRHHQKAEQDAENLKNGPLWAARGSTDTIKEWYRLQIMHVSSLILILSQRNRTAQRCRDAPQRLCTLNKALALTDQGHLLTREMVKRWFKQELAI